MSSDSPRRHDRRAGLVTATLTVLALALAGCVGPAASPAPLAPTASAGMNHGSAPPAADVAYTVQSRSDTGPMWVGVGGPIDGESNPTLTLKIGDTLRLTAKNSDGVLHDIGIRGADNKVLTPPGWSADIENQGDSVLVSWTPTDAGTYTYACRYHSGTQHGTIEVTA